MDKWQRENNASFDKLVRKDICFTNINPSDFSVIRDKNKYMRTLK